MTTVLFVCTANICRSPAAEHYLRHVAAKLAPLRVRAASAGILDFGGHGADPLMVRVLGEQGIDLGGHRARLATPEDLRRADRIVCMERRHRAWVVEQCPEATGKTSLLRDMLDAGGDVPDPIGGPIEGYREVADLLRRGVETLALDLKYPHTKNRNGP